MDADLARRFDSLIAHVETWADGGNSDGFADTLREVRAALAAPAVTETALPSEEELAEALHHARFTNERPHTDRQFAAAILRRIRETRGG